MEFELALRGIMDTPPEQQTPFDPQAEGPPTPMYPGTSTVTPGGSSPTLGKLFAALAKAQAEIGAAKKDSTNPFFQSNYADMASIVEVSRDPLAKQGLCMIQRHIPPTKPDHVHIETIMGHESGEWMRSLLEMPIGKNRDAQAFGTASTYACRYAYQAMIRIPGEDDDGNAASGRENPPAQQTTRRAAPAGKPMTNSEFAKKPPTEATKPKSPPAEAPSTQPYCPLCHAQATIYDGSKWKNKDGSSKGWVCGPKKGGCRAEYPIDDKMITGQDGQEPPEHVQAPPDDAGRFKVALDDGLGPETSTAFQVKWCKQLKIGSCHLLSLQQMVILHRIMEAEPDFIRRAKAAQQAADAKETF